MIFATIGNDKRPFIRFNKLVLLISDLFPKEEIIYQKGHNKFLHKKNNILDQDFFDRDQFFKYLKESSLVLTHAGAGTLMQLSKLKKVPYVLPRSSNFHEHLNNHQIETLAQFKFINLAKEIKYPFDEINLKTVILNDLNKNNKIDNSNISSQENNPLLISIRNYVEKHLDNS